MALPRPVITADDGGLVVSLTLAGRRNTVAGRDLYIAMVIAAAEVLNGADERELEWSRHNLQRKLQVCLFTDL